MLESRDFRVLVIAFLAFASAMLTLFLSSPILLADEEDPPREESVVGGEPVRNGQYRFVAALIDKTRTGSDYDRQFCGGTLIDRNSVLTAAHCVQGRSPNSLEVIVGRTVLSSDQGITRPVAKVSVHPKFRGSEVNSKYDAAVLTLRSTIDGIPPIRVSDPSDNGLEKPGNDLFVAGWGNTVKQQPSGSANSNFPDRMRQARVPVVSDSSTRASYSRPSLPSSLRFYPALMVGAGKSGKDTCQGDSGGPLFSKDGERIQVGITSYGAGCGAKGYPGVYTEVNSPQIRSFIVGAS